AYAAHERTRLAAGVDRDPEARRRFERRWEAPAYEDLEQALADCRPDVVSVCTPAEPRPAIVAQALEAGARAIWAEKPLAQSSAAAEQLVELCEQEGIPH